MSLTAASTLYHRAQCVRAASVTGQQTRSYWFDRDPSGYFRNAYRRYPSLRPRCVETIKQGLSWNKESAPEENKSYLKSVSFSYWRTSPRDCSAGERWASADSTFRTPDNPTGVRPGQNIEDAERAPLEDLLFGTTAELKPKWQIHKEKLTRKAAKRNKTNLEPEYVYDPVTNRKVPRPVTDQSLGGAAAGDTPNLSFKSYRSQFSSLQPPALDDKQAPIFYDGPPPPSELEKYAQVELDSDPWEANTNKPAAEPFSSPSPSTPSVPEVVNALENMQKEALGYQNDITTSKLGVSPAGSILTPDLDDISTQHVDGLGNKEAEYKAFRSHEPDGMYKAAPEQEDQSQELSKYKAVRSQEPDGKYNIDEQESSLQELSEYTAVRSHEPDGKYAVPYTDPTPDPVEVDHYSKPYLSHEPDGKYATSSTEPPMDEAELARYQPFRSHEPDGKYAAQMTAESKQEDVDQYQEGFRSHEPNGKYAAEVSTDIQIGEMEQYQGAFRSHEPNGKYAAEVEQAMEKSDLGNHEAYSSEDAKAQTMPSEEIRVTPDDAEVQTYKEIGHDEPVERNPADLWDKDPAVVNFLKQDATGTKTEYRKLVEGLMAQQGKEEEIRTAGDLLRTGQPMPSNAVKPALERNYDSSVRTKATSAGTSTEPQPTMLYKVLVYDPIMQRVDVAETTSVVPDSSAPLTPAEALLRISNPARFFPHFAPLEAEGFEIVSGSGDVLIFRKVRDLVQVPHQSVKSAETVSATKESPINPIDMTGGNLYNIAAGRFASPTGFVNYDLPPEETFARARENSMVRDLVGDHLTSEAKRQREEKEKKSRLGRRVAVGAFSLAGFMYALGLAGDTLKQGQLAVKGTNQKA
ncbi:hypothetical protein QBC43DRAFT_198544 [Cladorrhinum sp. PSN259]|nr:hypothetical protein QBC43DRAFT_198544 [Cladorrhinum sp. PSN259]